MNKKKDNLVEATNAINYFDNLIINLAIIFKNMYKLKACVLEREKIHHFRNNTKGSFNDINYINLNSWIICLYVVIYEIIEFIIKIIVTYMIQSIIATLKFYILLFNSNIFDKKLCENFIHK